VVSASTAAVQSYGALLAVRLVLGVTESVFFVGSVYYLSAWYTKSELGKRLAILYMGQMLGNAFGGLIAAGCLQLAGQRGISGWRWLFIIEGSITVFIGLLTALIMVSDLNVCIPERMPPE
jgi:MFS family permease